MKANVLIEGLIGSGKTHSLRTIVEAGQELFVISTEPGISSILGDIPCSSGCHWAYIPPGVIPWAVARANMVKINTYTIEQLIKSPGINKLDYTQLLDIYDRLADFHCDRCEKDFGPVDDWDESRTIAIDGLTGLSTMALQLVVGAKPIRSLPEWLTGQTALLTTTDLLCHGTKCNFVLISHVERERDEVSGKNNITVSTLGAKLATKVTKPFDEIIYARREIKDGKAEFFWSTTEPDVEQKVRILPWSDVLEPDFAQIFDRMAEMEKEAEEKEREVA